MCLSLAGLLLAVLGCLETLFAQNGKESLVAVSLAAILIDARSSSALDIFIKPPRERERRRVSSAASVVSSA